jgi:N-methylhydantoinase A
VKQYHEVSFAVPRGHVASGDAAAIARAFHAEHNRRYGYSLEQEGTPVEIINVRVQAVGRTDKPSYGQEAWAGPDATAARKGERSLYVPDRKAFHTVPVFDGHRMHFGCRVDGPALIEQETTAILVSGSFDCVVDAYGSFVLFRKGREDLVKSGLRRAEAGVEQPAEAIGAQA